MCKDFSNPTDELLCQMIDCGMSDAVPLEKAQLNGSLIYDRRFGVFYVQFGHHQAAMALLYARGKGFKNYHIASMKLKVSPSDMADLYLEENNACFTSSLHVENVKHLRAVCWNSNSLNEIEKDYFPRLRFIEENGYV